MSSDNWATESVKSSLDTDSVLSGYQSGRGRGTGGFWDSVAVGGSFSSNGEHTGVTSSWGNGQVDLTDFLPFGLTTTTVGYDMVGIKATEVGNMREAVRSYVTNVQSIVSTTLESNNEYVRKAFRGSEVESAVNSYVEKVKAYCQNVVSGLLVFSDKLADVGNAWITSTENMGSTVNASSGALNEGTAYSDDVQYRG